MCESWVKKADHNLIRSAAGAVTFCATIAMVLVHSFLGIARPVGYRFEFSSLNGLENAVLGTGLISLGLPVLAGFGLYFRLEPYLVGGKLRSFAMRRFVGLLLLLPFLEAVKNYYSFSWLAAFQWDALHFICLSFLIILFSLKYFGTSFLKLVWVLISVLTFLTSYLGIKIFSPWVVYPSAFSQISLGDDYVIGVIVVALLLFVGVWRAFLSPTQYFKRAPFVWGAAYFALVYSLIVQIVHGMQASPYFANVFYNLPVSILIQIGQGGGHIWPLFPWFGLVVLGFLLASHLTAGATNMRRIAPLSIAGAVGFFLFIMFYHGAFIDLLRSEILSITNIFGPEWSVYLGVSSLSLLLISISLVAHLKMKFVLNPLAQTLSDNVLWVYLLSFPATKLLLPGYLFMAGESIGAIFFFPVLVLAIVFCLIQGVELLHDKLAKNQIAAGRSDR